MRRIIQHADAATAGAYLAVFRERNALLSFMFHSIFVDEQEAARNLIHPLQRTTVSQFRRFIQYYRDEGYRFIALSDLACGVDPAGRYALITFDDGYFNNTRILPVLEEFAVPAAFFITTDNVQSGKCFWWDVHWRECAARAMDQDAIIRDGRLLKAMTTDRIEDTLIDRFGADALNPKGELDRPFTAEELRNFARHPHVQLGNHTASHAILTNYSADAVHEQLAGAQKTIEAITGIRPLAIAYPNGAHSPQIRESSLECGLKFGFTVEARKTRLPFAPDSADAMRIGRFMPCGSTEIEMQCRTFRSDVQFYGTLNRGFSRLRQHRRRAVARRMRNAV